MIAFIIWQRHLASFALAAAKSMDCFCFWAIALLVCGGLLITLIRKYVTLNKLYARPVFITGCDSGFGRLLATRLDKLGVPVYAGCLLEKSLQDLKEVCSSRLQTVQVDVTDTTSIRNAAEFVESDLNGRALWAIVNNAGIAGATAPFLWTTKKECQKIMDVNIMGVYDVTLAFLPLIKKGKEGRVVNIASVMGRIGIGASGYVLSKHAVEGFSDGLSYEVDPFNITVHTLEPGYFKTNLTESTAAKHSLSMCWDRLSKDKKEEYGGEEYLKALSTYIQKMMEENTSPHIELVVDAYEHALFAKYPHNRYHVGYDSKFFFIPLSFLPFKMQMWVLNTIQRLTGNERPSPKCALGR